MILYCDSSALVKLWVRERGSVVARRHVAKAQIIVVSAVAYAEIRAAMARRRHEGRMSARSLRRAVRTLDASWADYLVVDLDARIARRAGVLAEVRALRGFDAIHLATALEAAAHLGGPFGFIGYDQRLCVAAAAEGLTLV